MALFGSFESSLVNVAKLIKKITITNFWGKFLETRSSGPIHRVNGVSLSPPPVCNGLRHR